MEDEKELIFDIRENYGSMNSWYAFLLNMISYNNWEELDCCIQSRPLIYWVNLGKGFNLSNSHVGDCKTRVPMLPWEFSSLRSTNIYKYIKGIIVTVVHILDW